MNMCLSPHVLALTLFAHIPSGGHFAFRVIAPSLAAATCRWWAQTSNHSPTYRVLYAVIEALRFDPARTFVRLVGSSGLEPPTSRLSGARSNHLSYEPIQFPSVYLVSLTLILPHVIRDWLRQLAAWWR